MRSPCRPIDRAGVSTPAPGSIPPEEFGADRPREYEQLVASRKFAQLLVEPMPHYVVRGFRIFGATALTIGLILIFLIVWAQVFGYR